MTKRRILPLLLGLVALLLAGASIPHLHSGSEPGLWNQEHDLTLMAALGAHACQPAAMPVLGLVPALTATIVAATVRAAGAPLHLSDPRAPPLS